MKVNKKYRLTKLIFLDEIVGHKVGSIKNIVEIFENSQGIVIFVDKYGDYFLEEQLKEVVEVDDTPQCLWGLYHQER